MVSIEQDSGFVTEPLEVVDTDQDEELEKPLKSGVAPLWQPSGSFWTDAWYFIGPGWLVSIAYVDPGNFQADISAGAKTR